MDFSLKTFCPVFFLVWNHFMLNGILNQNNFQAV